MPCYPYPTTSIACDLALFFLIFANAIFGPFPSSFPHYPSHSSSSFLLLLLLVVTGHFFST
jgi:hypothetical protein